MARYRNTVDGSIRESESTLGYPYMPAEDEQPPTEAPAEPIAPAEPVPGQQPLEQPAEPVAPATEQPAEEPATEQPAPA